ncbi:type I restriction-modification system subunit M [bacterium]|nr:type I restriction-modification system subunit M [bacterium]
MYENAFKKIDDILRNEEGCSTQLDYIEQTSWLIFLKYINDYENESKKSSILKNKLFNQLIKDEFKWDTWASPKKEGQLDHNAVLTGDDLISFVRDKLFPYLSNFRKSAGSADTFEYKIGEIFTELRNKIESGYNMRDVIDVVDTLQFLSDKNKHEMSTLYEESINNMGNAGRNGGEYYTPRPLIKTIIKIMNPKIGEKIYDGAVGSAGFLAEAYSYLREGKELSSKDYEKLQKETLYGKEKKGLAYIIGTMNMILHGIEAPNILKTNTLEENINDIQDRDRVDIVITNPPFGSKERKEVKQNFAIESSETAYLFLQHFIKILKSGGRCGIVIKNTFLSNTDNASIDLRKQLLDECNLYAVLDMPSKTFLGNGVKTVVLFFKKGEPTKNIWYYQLNLDRNLGKTNPLNENDLEQFVNLFKNKEESENSWTINIEDINKETFDLTVKNPNKIEEVDNRTPEEIINEIEKLDQEATKALKAIKELM